MQWDWERPSGVKRCENEAQNACGGIWTANSSSSQGHGEVSPLPAGWTPPSRQPYGFSGVAAHPKHWIFADFKIGLENQILRPRMAKRGPKPSPNLPKWSPRLIKIQFFKHFWNHFFAWTICVDFFRSVLHFFKRPTPIKHCVGAVFLKISVFWENVKNHRKFFPEPSQNPSEIHAKSRKIE